MTTSSALTVVGCQRRRRFLQNVGDIPIYSPSRFRKSNEGLLRSFTRARFCCVRVSWCMSAPFVISGDTSSCHRPCLTQMFRLRAVDLFLLPEPATHLAAHPSNRVQLARKVRHIRVPQFSLCVRMFFVRRHHGLLRF